jgi:hypothetical protein
MTRTETATTETINTLDSFYCYNVTADLGGFRFTTGQRPTRAESLGTAHQVVFVHRASSALDSGWTRSPAVLYWNSPLGTVRWRRAERHLLRRWLSSGECAVKFSRPEVKRLVTAGMAAVCGTAPPISNGPAR